MSDAKEKVTAADIRGALRRKWANGAESSVVFEVAQGTGYAARRHLDAVAMELWPSRGLSVHGIEIKVNLYDFRKEAKDPEKAEEIARFCDYFWIAAPPNVVPLDELPSAWGLMELQKDARLTVTKAAMKTEAEPVSRMFMAALLRAATRPPDASEISEIFVQRAKEQDAKFNERVKEAARAELGKQNTDAEQWRRLVSALKGAPDEYIYEPEMIAALKFLIETNFVRGYGSVRHLHDSMVEFTKKVGDHIDLLNVPDRDSIQKLSDVLSRRNSR